MKLSLKELRDLISSTISEDIRTLSKKSLDKNTVGKERGAPKSDKEVSDQRKVVDGVRTAIAEAVSDGIKDAVKARLQRDNVVTYSDIEIITEPPKTLVRLKDVGGEKGQDMIYIINVTKIV